jgi:hypothetical protein
LRVHLSFDQVKENFEKSPEYVNNVRYLGIDPGKSNGVCIYNDNAELMFMITVPADDMTQFLKLFKNVKVAVVEDFFLYPNKAKQQIYSDMETSRVIGRIETWAELNDTEVIKQKATVKTTGYAWIGEKPLPKTNPMNHVLDAHVHFVYWAVRKGLLKAADLLK